MSNESSPPPRHAPQVLIMQTNANQPDRDERKHTLPQGQTHPAGAEVKKKRSWPARIAIIMLKIAVFAVVAYFVARALADQLGRISWERLEVSIPYLLASLGCVVAAWSILPLAYILMLRRLCRDLPWGALAGGIMVAQLGKYVPGKVASPLGMVYYLRTHGVDSKSALGSIIITDGLYIVVGLLTGFPLMLWGPYARRLPLAWAWCPALMIIALACLHPRIFSAMMNFALKRLGMAPIQTLPGFRNYIAPAAALLVQFVLMGAGVWLMARSLGEISPRLLATCVSALALGNTLGFMVLFIPAGIGIQEFAILALFTPMVGVHAAMLAVGMRLFRTTADILLAVVGAILLVAARIKKPARRAGAPGAARAE